MNPPTALIAEDEAPQREELQRLLADAWPGLAIVASCEDGLSALEALQAHAPTVAFLDIRMPGASGLEVARAVGPGTQVVFTTAYDEYAIAAFERGAVDYLLKPIRRERLESAVARVRERIVRTDRPDWSTLLDALQGREPSPRTVALKWVTASVGDAVKLFAIDEVLFFQAQDKYIRVVTAGDEAVIRTPLKELIAGLDPEQFWQVHRSAVVRASAIERVRRDELGRYQLSLRGRDDVLPVSSAFQHRFRGM